MFATQHEFEAIKQDPSREGVKKVISHNSFRIAIEEIYFLVIGLFINRYEFGLSFRGKSQIENTTDAENGRSDSHLRRSYDNGVGKCSSSQLKTPQARNAIVER